MIAFKNNTLTFLALVLTFFCVTTGLIAQTASFNVRIENAGQVFPFVETGAFTNPIGSESAAPAFPGDAYEFSFDAAVGDNLSIATMFVQSNDLFYAPGEAGIALYDELGAPITGDRTSELRLWDPGTELNETPGTGENQAPRQSGANVGEADSDPLVREIAVGEGTAYPVAEAVIRLTITHNGGTSFTALIENVSTAETLALPDGSTVAIPLSPGVYVVHSSAAPLFTVGEVDRGEGLEAIGEDGNPAILAESLAEVTGLTTILSPGVYVVHSDNDPIFTVGEADRGEGLEAIAEDGSPTALAEALAANFSSSNGAFAVPVGTEGPAPILPGGAYEFTITASAGDNLTLATMFVQSNDLFFAPDGEGTPLFVDGVAVEGDITADLLLWDAGTELNEKPGVGPNQAPRQAGADTGDADTDNTVRLVNDGFDYPATEASIRVTITPIVEAPCSVSDVSTVDGLNTVFTCPGDGIDDILEFTQTGANPDANFQYVVTDENFTVIGLPQGNMQNFEGAGEGLCYVWGYNYTGNILLEAGDPLFGTPFSDACYNLSRTAVRVIRAIPDGGMVTMPSGNTERTVCTVDGFDDVVRFVNNSTSSAAYTYVITDDQNNILGLPPSDNANFEDVPAGICRIWGLSFTGNITAMVGQNAAEVALTDGCFDLSDNFITINRTDVDGGTVSTVDGATEVTITAGDGMDDVIEFVNETTADANFTFIVTDDSNVVIGVPGGNSVNFEGAGPGICRVWGLSYTGDLRFLLGGTVGDFALSTDCYQVSENFVNVIREASCAVEGGMIATDASTTGTELTICAGDGESDAFDVTLEGNTGNSAWVITDAEGTILALPPSPPFDLEGAGPGVCLVWHLSFDEGFAGAEVGNNATTDLTGCFDLSNPITVIRESVNGGMVTTIDGATEVSTTAGDGVADVIQFASTDASGGNFAYVVTDQDGVILGLPPANEVDFEGAGPGVCLVWGLSYTGEVTVGMGDNALESALSDGCFDLSDNFVTVTRTSNANQIEARNGNSGVISLYPNPTATSLQVEFTSTASETIINITDAFGRTVQQNTVQAVEGFNQLILDVNDLAAGTYFVNIQTDANIQTLSFVKE